MEEFIKIILGSKLMTSGSIIVLAYLVYKVLKFCIDKSTTNKKINGKKITYIKLFMNLLKYVLIIISIFIILQLYGVNVSSLLAGLGIAGILEWNGVMDAQKDEVAPLNENKIDELFSNFWAVAENFRYQYCGLHEIIEAEKNVYTPEPNGTSVTGEVIAKDVEKEKSSAHSISASTPKHP